jgi:anaerobic magnesium-protoporphyrin IX monomethyl ester cyclase
MEKGTMKILIILLRFNKFGYVYDRDSIEKVWTYLPPLGLAYISAVLKGAGHDVECLNLNHYDGHIRDILILYKGMVSGRYDVVFIGGLSLYYSHIKDIISYIREITPRTKIIVGGGIMTAQPEIMFRLLKPDYGIIGEGEQTAVELAQAIVSGTNPYWINGIIYAGERGKLIITPERQPIENLDVLPFPDYDSFGFKEYLDHVKPSDYIAYDVEDVPRYYPILASRSCPYSCTFCFHPLGKKYRQRSIDSVMEEIKYAVPKYRANIIFLYDELFSNDKERVFEFCRKFKEYASTVPWKVWFYASMRVDTTDNEMVARMKDAGGYLLSFGLESYSQTVLDSMKKHTTPAQIKNAFEICKANNMGIQGSFIFGDVNETCDTAKETLDFFTGNPDLIRGGVQVGFIVPFQGSPIYTQCVRERKIKDEVAFIENRAIEGYDYNRPMNLANLNDKDFERLKDKVLAAHMTAWRYSIPKKVTSRRVCDYPDYPPVYTNGVKVACPYCGEVSTINNMEIPKGAKSQNVGCRYCFARFHMVSRGYLFIRFLIKTIGFNNTLKLKRYLGVGD